MEYNEYHLVRIITIAQYLLQLVIYLRNHLFCQVSRIVGKCKVKYGIQFCYLLACQVLRGWSYWTQFSCFFLIEVTRYLRRPFLFTSETKADNKTLQGMVSWISGSSGFMCREKLVTLLQMWVGKSEMGIAAGKQYLARYLP